MPKLIIDEKTKAHLLAHPGAEAPALEAWEILMAARKPLGGVGLPYFIREAIPMGRVVGRSGCVATSEFSETFWACRAGRTLPSRMVAGVDGPEVETVVLLAVENRRDRYDTYKLITAYVGELAPRELHDPTLPEGEREESGKFWSTHALIADGTEGPMLDPSTLIPQWARSYWGLR